MPLTPSALPLILLLATVPGVAADVPVWEIALAVGAGVLALLLCLYAGYLVMRTRRQTPADVETALTKTKPKLIPGQGKVSGSASGQGRSSSSSSGTAKPSSSAATTSETPPLATSVSNGLSQAAGAVTSAASNAAGAVTSAASNAAGAVTSAASNAAGAVGSAVKTARTNMEDTEDATATAKAAAAGKTSAEPTRVRMEPRVVERVGQDKQGLAFARRSPRM